MSTLICNGDGCLRPTCYFLEANTFEICKHFIPVTATQTCEIPCKDFFHARILSLTKWRATVNVMEQKQRSLRTGPNNLIDNDVFMRVLSLGLQDKRPPLTPRQRSILQR